jgi:hypothetical protein
MKSPHLLVIVAFSCCVLAFTGCTTSSGVMAASGGTYTITKSGQTGFTPLGSLRKDAYEEARKFAASKGMEAEVIAVNEVPTGFARWPQVDLRFRLVSAAAKQSGEKAPALTIASQASHDAMGNATDAETRVVVAKQEDLYSELKKLGELKDKGLLTEEEFQKEKKRLFDARDK